MFVNKRIYSMIKTLTVTSIIVSLLFSACVHEPKEAKPAEVKQSIDTLKEGNDKGSKAILLLASVCAMPTT